MKKPTFLLLILTTFVLYTNAQNLDRVTISSGGISADEISATIGEVFVFSVSDGDISFDAGGQSDEENTGGLTDNDTPIKSPEIVANNKKITVYPNPVQDNLNMQINGLENSAISFQIYDATGKLVKQHNANNSDFMYQIRVNELPQGNYFIKGFTAKGESIGEIKFIKL
jgi:hypothetical protein